MTNFQNYLFISFIRCMTPFTYTANAFMAMAVIFTIITKKMYYLFELVFNFQGLNVVYFLIETLYSFTPNIYIVFAMIAFEGLLGGSAYSNTYHQVMIKV